MLLKIGSPRSHGGTEQGFVESTPAAKKRGKDGAPGTMRGSSKLYFSYLLILLHGV
jgi:hypothetical protein